MLRLSGLAARNFFVSMSFFGFKIKSSTFLPCKKNPPRTSSGVSRLVAPGLVKEDSWKILLARKKSEGFYFKTRKTYGNKNVAGCKSAKPKHLLGKTKIILLGFGALRFTIIGDYWFNVAD